MTKNIAFKVHNGIDPDTGAMINKGRLCVRDTGNKNIVFTIITGPEWDKRTN